MTEEDIIQAGKIPKETLEETSDVFLSMHKSHAVLMSEKHAKICTSIQEQLIQQLTDLIKKAKI